MLGLSALFMATALVAEEKAPGLEERVKAVVRELESDSYRDRNAGVQHLVDLPPEALAYLDKALATTKDPEVIARIQGSIERLRTKARETALSKRAEVLKAWELKAATKGYASQKHGPWDGAVKDGFEGMAKLRDGRGPAAWKLCPPEVFTTLHKAIAAGCEDPLVSSYYLKSGSWTGELDAEGAKKVIRRIYPDILKSAYEPALKLQVVLDYVEGLEWLDREAELWTEAERAGALRAGIALWPEIVKDKAVPDAVLELLAEKYWRLAVKYGETHLTTLDLLSGPWLKARPASAGPFALRTNVYIGYARELRGDRWTNILEGQKLEQAKERVETAREAAEEAYKRDVTDTWAPTAMIAGCNVIGADRAEMEKWYARVAEADPENFEACANKLLYLRDQVGKAETVAFGRECFKAGHFEGPAPLALVLAHELVAQAAESAEAAKAYLESEEVWDDYAAVYGKFLALHRGDVWERYCRSRFARDACLAEKWKTALAQFQILGDKPSLGVFESMGSYNYWRRKAKRMAGEK
jgi:hypothetical protein